MLFSIRRAASSQHNHRDQCISKFVTQTAFARTLVRLVITVIVQSVLNAITIHLASIASSWSEPHLALCAHTTARTNTEQLPILIQDESEPESGSGDVYICLCVNSAINKNDNPTAYYSFCLVIRSPDAPCIFPRTIEEAQSVSIRTMRCVDSHACLVDEARMRAKGNYRSCRVYLLHLEENRIAGWVLALYVSLSGLHTATHLSHIFTRRAVAYLPRTLYSHKHRRFSTENETVNAVIVVVAFPLGHRGNDVVGAFQHYLDSMQWHHLAFVFRILYAVNGMEKSLWVRFTLCMQLLRGSSTEWQWTGVW